MTIRIRYTKTRDPDVVRSVRNFKGNKDGMYQIKINTKDRTYKIINVRSQRILRSSEKDGVKPPKNVYTVYEQVKRALSTLGVNFDHEFRNLED